MTRAADFPAGEAVEITASKPCDLCADGTTVAVVDGKTVFGPWANMCQMHFDTCGFGLGVGRGQRLIVVAS